ncbi:Late embryogenesis abundant protein, LEA-14 [Melia azedarach]|uniref:Late embryogenesis abundant protein, LEA-14 n=1 Tax=Melia azedarach TaxID=155640 RepID=A0ACC1Z349_MELAZ|nr:Late embryogenesis abundant protein, LEA-14 [Melia azedarach]
MDCAHKRDDVQATETMSAPSLPPKYVMLDNNQNLRPPPQRRNLPPYHSHSAHKHHKSGGNCCLKFICCCYCCLFVLILIFTILAYVCYATLKPAVPRYNIQSLVVKSLRLPPDFATDNEMTATVKANNPNEYISIKYEQGLDNRVEIIYSDRVICEGDLPEFEQPEKNVSIFQIPLKGLAAIGLDNQETFMADRKAGKIPLLVHVKAPITIQLGSFTLKKVVVEVNCKVIVDNLTPGEKVGIVSNTCNYDWS